MRNIYLELVRFVIIVGCNPVNDAATDAGYRDTEEEPTTFDNEGGNDTERPKELALEFDTSACADMTPSPEKALIADFENGSSRGVSENSSGFFYYQRDYESRTVTTALHKEFPSIRAVKGACTEHILKFDYAVDTSLEDSLFPTVVGIRIFLQIDENGRPMPVDVSRFHGVTLWYAAQKDINMDFCLIDEAMYPGDTLTPDWGPWGASWAMAWFYREYVFVDDIPAWHRLDIDFDELTPSASIQPESPMLTAVYALQLEFESNPGDIYFDEISFFE